MTLRAQLESFPADAQLLVFTTLGHVYVGSVVDIEEDAIRLARPDGLVDIVLALGDVSGVREALGRGRALLDAMATPDRPDHHFVVDPDKWDFYAMDAYRLAGDDDLAAGYARTVLAWGAAPDGERAPMRMAEARLTLAAVAARAGDLEQAVTTGMAALGAARKSLPSLLMVAGELDVELHRRYPGEAAADEFRVALREIG